MKRRDNRGFTLVEVLLSLFLVVLIAGVISLLNIYGIRSYRFGSEQADEQRGARLADTLVTHQLKYAVEAELFGAPDRIEPGGGSAYLYREGSSIKYQSGGESRVLFGEKDGRAYTLDFAAGPTLTIVIGRAGGGPVLEIAIELVNLPDGALADTRAPGDSMAGIRWKLAG